MKKDFEAPIGDAYRIFDKAERYARLGELRSQAVAQLAAGEAPQFTEDEVTGVFSKIEKQTVRGRVVAGEPRIDGRDTKTVRPLHVEVGVLPKVQVQHCLHVVKHKRLWLLL